MIRKTKPLSARPLPYFSQKPRKANVDNEYNSNEYYLPLFKSTGHTIKITVHNTVQIWFAESTTILYKYRKDPRAAPS
jgi:hypothetical protein